MSTELTAPTNMGGNSGGDKRPTKPTGGASGGGTSSNATGSFFRLYKPGQGYWTRLGTAIGAAGVILFISWFAFNQSSIFLTGRGQRFGVAVGVAAVLAVITWWLMNGSRRAQFLIDTDSEMKKVNWAGWSELIGSTRIVVFFMVLTALTLFVLDTQYHAFFFGLSVWHIPFDSHMGIVTGGLLGFTLLAIGFGLYRGNKHEPTKRGTWMAMVSTIAGVVILAVWAIYLFKRSTVAA